MVTSLILVAFAALVAVATVKIASTGTSRFATCEEGALNTQFALLAGVGAVIALALGALLYTSVTDTGKCITTDFKQVSDGAGNTNGTKGKC